MSDMAKVDFATKDHGCTWEQKDFDRLGKIPGVIHDVPIEHLIDMNMMVKGPEEMSSWLNENAIQLWDVGSVDDIGFKDGKVYVKLPCSNEWVELNEDLLEKMFEENEWVEAP